MNQIKRTIDSRGKPVYTLQLDEKNKLIAQVCVDASQYSFVIGFVCESDKRWYYQHLHWSCRGGKREYYRAVAELYRYLRKNKITEQSLHNLASGEHPGRNGGYAIRTESYRRHVEGVARIKLQRAFFSEVEQQLELQMATVARQGWVFKRNGGSLGIHSKQPNAAGKVCSIWVPRPIGSVILRRYFGRPDAHYNPEEGNFRMMYTSEDKPLLLELGDDFSEPKGFINKVITQISALMFEMDNQQAEAA